MSSGPTVPTGEYTALWTLSRRVFAGRAKACSLTGARLGTHLPDQHRFARQPGPEPERHAGSPRLLAAQSLDNKQDGG